MKKLLLFVVILASIFSSCGDDEITRDPDSLGYQYYPLEVGNYWIYNVTENEYRNNVISRTTTYQSRERIDAIIKDQTGKEWYRVEVSRRNTSEPWAISGVKLISRSASDLRIQENNKTTVHMVYPVKNGYSFISNAFIDGSEDNRVYYTYANLGEAFTQNGTTYDNTLTLVQAETDNFVELEEKFEILAAGTGPVKRSNKAFTYCDGSTGSTCEYGTGYIVSGSAKVEILESSGKTE